MRSADAGAGVRGKASPSERLTSQAVASAAASASRRPMSAPITITVLPKKILYLGARGLGCKAAPIGIEAVIGPWKEVRLVIDAASGKSLVENDRLFNGNHTVGLALHGDRWRRLSIDIPASLTAREPGSTVPLDQAGGLKCLFRALKYMLLGAATSKVRALRRSCAGMSADEVVA